MTKNVPDQGQGHRDHRNDDPRTLPGTGRSPRDYQQRLDQGLLDLAIDALTNLVLS